MNKTENVSTAKPKIGGAIHRAVLGTTVPTDAVTALTDAYKSLGYIGEEGMTNGNSPETDRIKAWGGDTVVNYQKDKPDTFKFILIESTNPEVLKTVYGDDNVKGDLNTGISVDATTEEFKECVWVIDMILKGGILKRIVIPQGVIIERGDTVYKDDTLIAYEVTVMAMPINGTTHHEYMIKPGVTPANQTEGTGA